ncbi:MAG: hypothetical protein M1834_003200 [Cirrosporium novae-zelandiae]|nr:MAG: hypothetical protein M1834_003200 [Cirrosporium novae-zelandiae]
MPAKSPLRIPFSFRRKIPSVRRSFSVTRCSSAEEVRIVEVGPRDGLQNEKATIPLRTKLELIDRLALTGLQTMEAGSFVPSKWVPQMAGTSDIMKHLISKPPLAPHSIAYNFLVPNVKGLDNMIAIQNAATPETPSRRSSTSSAESQTSDTSTTTSESETDPFNPMEISLFAAATDAFSKANTNCTIAESIERCKPIIALAQSKGIRVRGYVSVAFGCPYEGPDVSPSVVADITATLLELGADEVSLGDTTGMGTAKKTRELLKTLTAAGILPEDIALHFHDTYGQALVNAAVGLEHGVRIFDSSVGGLGGCPYSKGATGNIATEDLVYFFHSLGIKTGVNLEKMAEVGDWITRELGKENQARAGKAILARMHQQ